MKEKKNISFCLKIKEKRKKERKKERKYLVNWFVLKFLYYIL